jgi:hypothetical protein
MALPAPTCDALNERMTVLLEAVALLLDEQALLAEEDWVKLPELRKKKVIAAARLRHLRAETEAADGTPLRSLETQISELEAQSQRTIRSRLNYIGYQFLALQELSLHLNESLHVSVQRGYRPAANG